MSQHHIIFNVVGLTLALIFTISGCVQLIGGVEGAVFLWIGSLIGLVGGGSIANLSERRLALWPTVAMIVGYCISFFLIPFGIWGIVALVMERQRQRRRRSERSVRRFGRKPRAVTLRRAIWNIYAWPITLLLVESVISELANMGLLRILDVAISVSSLIALHLHIWDKRFLSTKFWKPYAFFFVAWDLFYNLLLEPIFLGKHFDPRIFIFLVILSPLYVAVFRYAFRKWDRVLLPNHAAARPA